MKLVYPILKFGLLTFLGGTVVAIQSEATSASSKQLFLWAVNSSYYEPLSPATNLQGQVIPSMIASETVGERGELLVQDYFFIEKIASFNRERIPERVVHAKGTGAHGYFVVTHDVSFYTKANFLNGIGKKTPVFCRFSTATGGTASPDTAVDPHGFATKFYTDSGNHDILAFNIEPFPIRDPMLFPDLTRSRKRNPVTGMLDHDMWWDFVSLRPETTNQILHLFSDRGRPESYRRIDGFAVNAFTFINSTNGLSYGKFIWKSETPWKSLTYQEAEELRGSNPDYKTKDLYDAIARGDYPMWRLYIQVMPIEYAKTSPIDPFDLTRNWPRDKFPLIPVGKMVLNRSPSNHFAEVEQAAFAPSTLAPGVAPSPDRILTGRLFAYQDAQRYRLGGPNFAMLPINRPLSPVTSYMRDGTACHGDNGDGSPNYYPNSFGGLEIVRGVVRRTSYWTEGVVSRYGMLENDVFEQPRLFLEQEVSRDERIRLVESIADWLSRANTEVQERVLRNNFYPVSNKFGDEIREAIENVMQNKQKGRKLCIDREEVQSKGWGKYEKY